ncbi:hypothetical protein ACU6TU_08355 [Halomonas sp. LS-001]
MLEEFVSLTLSFIKQLPIINSTPNQWVSALIGLLALFLTWKFSRHNGSNNYMEKRRQFLVDCKPLFNNQSMQKHEEKLIKDSYLSLTGKKLNILTLRLLIEISNTNSTLTEFIIAGHLIKIRRKSIIKKDKSILFRVLSLTLFFAGVFLVLAIYFFILHTLPNHLSNITTDESKKAITIMYLLFFASGVFVTTIITRFLQKKIDEWVSLRRLLKLN